jgi:intein/homing endonuclease
VIKPDQREWAYLAGFFDAEGCVSGTKPSKGKFTYNVGLITPQKDRRPLDWLEMRFGGHVSSRGIDDFAWLVLLHPEKIWVLNGMVSFLRIKEVEATVALQLLKMSPKERSNDQAKRLWERLRDLKKERSSCSVPKKSYDAHLPPKRSWKWAYLAGFFDGEGTIIGSKVDKSKDSYKAHVRINNTNAHPIAWIYSQFGGSVTTSINPSGRLRYNWSSNSKKDKLPLLEGMLPYLIVKRDEARLAIKLTNNGQGVQARHLCKEIKRLKRANYVTS